MDRAGTDEDIYIQIDGEQGITRKETLERTQGDDAEKYSKGQTYEFSVSLLDVGKVSFIKCLHDLLVLLLYSYMEEYYK